MKVALGAIILLREKRFRACVAGNKSLIRIAKLVLAILVQGKYLLLFISLQGRGKKQNAYISCTLLPAHVRAYVFPSLLG